MRAWKRAIAIASLALVLIADVVAQQPGGAAARAQLDAGVIVGTTKDGVERYLGVPFAKPPLGPLRWQPPQPPEPWKGERAATEFSLPCWQETNADGKTLNGGGVSGASSEDCLYLNVYAPATAKGDAPVMVWFFGGGNVVGGAHLPTYDGQSFARDGVVVVTLNYRLGAAGWFAHPALTKSAPKDQPLVSYGSMDQTEALRWVQRNIKAFGGDPKNVTLFGQSAGGYGVYSQILSPQAEGLFHKAMVHSATYIRPNATLSEAEAAGARRASSWGLDGANATLEQMRAIPIEKLGGLVGGAVVDGRYFVEPWVTSIAYKRHPAIPFVVGGNSGEGALWARDRWVAEQFAETGAPAFQYYFSHVRAGLDAKRGAVHSAELRFAWDTLGEGARDQAVADAMHPCWVAFAFYAGKGDIKCGNGVSWPAYSPAEHPVLEFTTSGPKVHKTFRTDEEWAAALGTRE